VGTREELVRECERLFAIETRQAWLWSVLGIAKRRGGAMIEMGGVCMMAAYRETAGRVCQLLGRHCRGGVDVLGEVMRMRLASAFGASVWLEGAAEMCGRGFEYHVTVEEAVSMMELRRATQRVVDAVLSWAREQRELIEEKKGGVGSGNV